MRIYLGGTCNKSIWRSTLISLFDKSKGSFFFLFNSAGSDCDEGESPEEELLERQKCDICLYTITPKMTSVYPIAEVLDDSYRRAQNKTILILLRDDENKHFDDDKWKSLKAVAKMVRSNGGLVFFKLKTAADFVIQLADA